jgi:Bacteriophage probable baseplate hub protein
MTPIYKITADNKDITAIIREYLVSLTITDDTGITSDSLKLIVADPLNNLASPRKGAKLKISIGFKESELIKKGKFTVDTVKFSGPPSKIDISAKGADFRKELRQPKNRSWHEIKLGDILKKIADEHGLIPKIPAELANIFITHADQTDESDIHFLTRLANERDAVAKPAGNYLMLVKKADSKTASGKNLPTFTFDKSVVTVWNASLPDRDRFGSVTAIWVDKDNNKEVKESTGTDTPVWTIRKRFATAAEAKTAASSTLKRLNRRNAKCSLTVPGNPALIAEASINLTGFRDGVNGLWIIKKVSHRIASGYSCQIDCEPK